jgi:hypothetical protein
MDEFVDVTSIIAVPSHARCWTCGSFSEYPSWVPYPARTNAHGRLTAVRLVALCEACHRRLCPLPPDLEEGG